MAISISIHTLPAEITNTHRIFTSYTPGLSRREVQEKLAELTAKGGLTERDELLLRQLRELNVLSLNQIHRLLWPASKTADTARRRLFNLIKYHLLDRVRMPAAQMEAWRLPSGLAYTLGPGGRVWLQDQVDGHYAYHLKRGQTLHDLLVAECYTRLAEAVLSRGSNWQLHWTGERGASYKKQQAAAVEPDGLAVIHKQEGEVVAELSFFIEMDAGRESHGRLSSQWGRKVNGYDQFYAHNVWQNHAEAGSLQHFPLVLVVTHGERRLQNLAAAITEHRRQPVVYYLGLWDDLGVADDLITAPAWLIITPNGDIVGQAPAERRALIKS